MLKEAREIADKYGDTGVYRIRTMLIVCIVTVRCHAQGLYHRIKGDYDAWLDILGEE